MSQPILPLALINNSFLGVRVGTLPMPKTVKNQPFIETLIRPIITAHPSYLIIFEFAFVFGAVSPDELSLPMQEAVPELALEGVAFPELTRPLPMVDLTDLAILFEVYDVSGPILDHQLSQLGWQERHLWQRF